MRKTLRRQGLSKDSVRLFQAQFRPSTSNVYNNHWESWKSWCADNNVSDPMNPDPRDLANHLSFLSTTLGLSAATLKTRRAAIGSVLAARGDKAISSNPIVAGVVKGAANLNHRQRTLTPKWDLAVVLNFLKSPTMKDNKLLDFKHLTWKTVFLVALASGRRASEISNLSGIVGDISLSKKGAFSLKFLPEFLAKNQNPEDPSPHILIPPLSDVVGRESEDLALCPVRALKEYRARSNRLRSPSQRALFISINVNHSRDITRATLSRWLKTTIKNAYHSLSRKVGPNRPALTPVAEARAHEIRAWAATLAAKSTPMAQVLKAAYWRSSTVFVRHYLRDIAHRSENGILTLPAMVAAQTPLAARQ